MRIFSGLGLQVGMLMCLLVSSLSFAQSLGSGTANNASGNRPSNLGGGAPVAPRNNAAPRANSAAPSASPADRAAIRRGLRTLRNGFNDLRRRVLGNESLTNEAPPTALVAEGASGTSLVINPATFARSGDNFSSNILNTTGSRQNCDVRGSVTYVQRNNPTATEIKENCLISRPSISNGVGGSISVNARAISCEDAPNLESYYVSNVHGTSLRCTTQHNEEAIQGGSAGASQSPSGYQEINMFRDL